MLWSSQLGRNVPYHFLRWILSHKYNFETNNNDVADLLWLVCPIDVNAAKPEVVVGAMAQICT